MGTPARGVRLSLVGAVVAVVLALMGGPASSQTSSTLWTPAVEPNEVVDVYGFADRANQWSEARRRARERALQRAQELADAARSTTTTTTVAARTTATTTTTTEPPAATEPSPPVRHQIPAGTTEAQWHALRQCESTQNYRAISSSGRYRGAYQFSIRTWDWVAGMHYPDLVGVDPIDASPPDQDKMAYQLYEINGWDPWPTCKKRLPS